MAIGLTDQQVETGDALTSARELVRGLAQGPARAQGRIKAGFRQDR